MMKFKSRKTASAQKVSVIPLITRIICFELNYEKNVLKGDYLVSLKSSLPAVIV
ncbi:hypothetical protein Hanom_Chr11g01058381 [Helianthus anomalus]